MERAGIKSVISPNINSPMPPLLQQHPPFFILCTHYSLLSFSKNMLDFRWLKALFCLAALSQVVRAHMRMSNPPPIRSPEEGIDVDFDQTSPLGVFPCKGFHTLPGHSAVATFAAGSTVPVK